MTSSARMIALTVLVYSMSGEQKDGSLREELETVTVGSGNGNA